MRRRRSTFPDADHWQDDGERGGRFRAPVVSHIVSPGIEALMTTIYGIKNCDTMKRARAWLDGHTVDYDFHDYKSHGIDRPTLEGWVKKLGWDVLLNRAGTTFRKLPDTDKEDLTEKKAIALMLAQPSMIKRPVLEAKGKFTVGFRPEDYKKLFG
jgi:Spx/MgsR family transcriptional regulator